MRDPGRKVLTLALIAKNESSTLPRLVSSFQGWYDELIVCDTGSEDDTVAVAESLGAKVITFPWIDDFAAARNKACEGATSEWTFCPDCDEYFRNPEAFYDYLASLPPEVNLCQVDLHTTWADYKDIDDKGKVLNLFPAQRCFRTGTHKWIGAGHEYLQTVEGVKGCSTYFKGGYFEHHPIATKSRSFYINILRKQANAEPTNARYQHYMGREAMYHGLHSEAIGYFEQTLKYHHWDYERCQTRLYLADCLMAIDKKDEAETELIMSLKEQPTRRDSTFKLGEFYRAKGDWHRAEIWFRMCLSLPRYQTAYFTNEDLYGVMPALRLSYCLWQMGNMKEAFELYNRAAAENPEHPEVIQNKHFFDLPPVSIIIPTRFREESLQRTLAAIQADERSYPQAEVIVWRDEGEEAAGCPKAVNKALSRCNHDYICYLGNDCIPQPGWLLRAMTMMKTFPERKGMVGFNSEYRVGTAEHFVIHKDLLNLLPYNEGRDKPWLFNEAYEHSFVDNELMEVMWYNHRYRWCPSSIVKHSWVDARCTSPGVDVRARDACDDRVSTAYSRDMEVFNERAPLWRRPLTFGAIIPAFQDAGPDSYLKEVLSRVIQVIPKENILGIMGPPMMSGIEFEDPSDAGTRAIFEEFGVNVMWSDSPNEAERRTAGVKKLDKDFCFIIDSDEVWEPADLEKLMKSASQNTHVECWRASTHNYWKTVEWRVDPIEPYKRPVLVSQAVNFTQSREVDAGTNMVHPEVVCHHYNYACFDETVKRKLAFYDSPFLKPMHPLVPGWYENVWLKWTPEVADTMLNLHPTHPEAWHKAIKARGPI